MSQPHPGTLTPTVRPLSPRRAWYVLLLFAALLMSSYIDRFILTVLAQPLSVELGVSDKQVGLLMGIGFSLCYAIVGMPLAWLLDRGARIRIVTIAALLWGTASFASAFAPNFTWLIALRGLIAIGEAALTPAAVSLIPDLFPEQRRRAFPTSVYFSVSVAGTTLTYVIGAGALDLATRLQPLLQLSPWRGALAIGALPGLFLAILLGLSVQEPARTPTTTALSIREPASVGMSHFLRDWPLYLAFYVGLFACTTAPLAVHAWLPTGLARQYGVSTSNASLMLGISGTIGGVIGAFGWPALAAIAEKPGGNRIKLTLMIAASLAGGASTLSFLFHDASVTIVAFGALFAFFGAHAPLAALVLQSIVPSNLRARAMAINTLVVILGALSVAPLLVPETADILFDGQANSLILAMTIVAPIAAALGAITLSLALWRLVISERGFDDQ